MILSRVINCFFQMYTTKLDGFIILRLSNLLTVLIGLLGVLFLVRLVIKMVIMASQR